jgi:hypothetical protein
MLSPPPHTAWTFLLALLVFAAILIIGRRGQGWTLASTTLTPLLEHPLAPFAAGIITSLLLRFVWGSFDEPGIIHDERAYLLQASIFAGGHWTAPSPPIPAFFEQMHVFLEPAIFAKYPPVHALLLAPGVWLGRPGLMPSLLLGVSGALIFWIARRLTTGWVAFFTWWMWTTAWVNLHWSASYFSQTTSTAFWWLAVFATIRWLDSGRTIFLAVVAAALALGIETRPLTMTVATGLLGFIIAWRLMRVGSWRRTLVVPLAVALAILTLEPVWRMRTLGDWRLNPYRYYSRVYFPFDKPGFGVDNTPPLREVPPELAAVDRWSRDVHTEYVPSAVPSALALRLLALFIWVADGWRLVVAGLIGAAVLFGSRVERLGLLTLAALFLAYLSFAHPPMWIVYYVEVFPIVYFVAACQLGRLLHKVGAVPRADSAHCDRSDRWPAPVASAAAITAVLFIGVGVYDVVRVRAGIDQRNEFQRSARSVIEANTAARSLVFVSYVSDANPHTALTWSVGDIRARGRWIVFDRGPKNDELRKLAPGVPAFRLDAGTLRLEKLTDSTRSNGLSTDRSSPAGSR